MATADRTTLTQGLVAIGENAVAKSNDALLDEYFTDNYRLHSPAGDFNRAEIKAYFAALRKSFTGFTRRNAAPGPQPTGRQPVGAHGSLRVERH